MPDEPEPQSSPVDGEEEREPINKWVWFFLGAVLIFAVVVTLPMIKKERMKAKRALVINSLRQIGIGLFEFDTEYGTFPDSETAVAVKEATGSALTLSDRTSNDIFVQLLASGICTTEGIFDTHSTGTRKPDGDWSSDGTALEHGETGFAFIFNRSAHENPDVPLLLGPVIPGTKTFDAKSFGGIAVMLKLDNSVTSVPIDSAGRIIIYGFDLLDPQNPIWNGKAPDIKWPK